MKKILLVVPLFIASCAVIPTAYSPTLYNHAVELAVMTHNAAKTCTTPQVQIVAETLRIKSEVIVKYTQYVSKDVNEVATKVNAEYTEFAAAYHDKSPSEGYCTMKIQLLSTATESMLEMLGSKPQ